MSRSAFSFLGRRFSAMRDLGLWWLGALLELWHIAAGRLAPQFITRLVARPDDSVLSLRLGQKEDGPLLLRCNLTAESNPQEHSTKLQAILAAHGKRALLVMPQRDVLSYQFTLPGMLDRHVDSAVTLYLERELPIPLERVCVYYQLAPRSRRRDGVTMAIHVARRDRIEYCLRRVEELGLQVIRIAVQDEAGRIVGNFLPRRTGPGWPHWTRTDRKLAMAAAALSVLAVTSMLGQWTYERGVVEREIDQLQNRSVRATQLLEELENASAQAAVFSGIMQHPDAADLLEILTASIPDDAWVYEIELQAHWSAPHTVTLRGFASANFDPGDALQPEAGFSRVRTNTRPHAGLEALQAHFELQAEWDGALGAWRPTSSEAEVPGTAP